MNKVILVFFILICLELRAQVPAAPVDTPASYQTLNPRLRPRPPDDPNKESSSFIGDPENIDPLRPRRDSLKEDEEPVLEDIRDIKGTATGKSLAAAGANSGKNPDEPDAAIEKKFYRNYQRYNAVPTSVEDWSKITLGRNSEVYIVQKGDTLWSISETLFGDSLFWPKIWAINRQGISNPHFILPGMKIYFYPGTQDDYPTLSVGEDGQNSVLTSNGVEQEMVTANGTKIRSKSRSAGSSASLSDLQDAPTPLPPSLPIYRSEIYYSKPREVKIVDLQTPKPPKPVYQSDIILTDRLVISDLKISPEGNRDLACVPGELLEEYKFVRNSPTNEYTILQPLDPVKSENDTLLYPYQLVGKITQYGQKKLRIKECHSYLNREQIFVPSDVVQSLKTQKNSTKAAQIIGGPVVYDQVNYMPSQLVYVNMGNLSFNNGQSFDVKSLKIDMAAGKIRILDRFGSYALAVITEVDRPIRVGDEIIPQ
jgi:hypothetical protein